MTATFYRRPLPKNAISFSGPEGKTLFAEALAAGDLEGYFPLAEQFHTQAEPTFCGLGSLVVALNALAIDPGRLWKGPWRWFGEELLDCCVPLERVRSKGLDLDELACLARCNGAEVTLARAGASDLESFRHALKRAARAEAVFVASYDRSVLGQTGSGHFSPIGGYHRARDLALILDVARFKYPPHWVSAELLFEAMRSIDPDSGKSRGWLVLRPRAHGLSVGFSIKCDGHSWRDLVDDVAKALGRLEASGDVDGIVRAVAPLASYLELRTPTTDAHREAIESARAALRALPLYARVSASFTPEQAELVAILLLASVDLLDGSNRTAIDGLVGRLDEETPLAVELENVRAQIAALRAHVA